jgi:hypothetical protein
VSPSPSEADLRTLAVFRGVIPKRGSRVGNVLIEQIAAFYGQHQQSIRGYFNVKIVQRIYSAKACSASASTAGEDA